MQTPRSHVLAVNTASRSSIDGSNDVLLPGSAEEARSSDATGSPLDLRDDTRLASFVERAIPVLERAVPPWMAYCARDALVDAVLDCLAEPERFASLDHVLARARVALRHQAGRIRKRTVRREIFLDQDSDQTDPRNVEAKLVAADALGSALEKLPEALRRTLLAVKVLGLTAAEHAQAEGVAVQTVHNRVHEALSRMRAILSEDEPS